MYTAQYDPMRLRRTILVLALILAVAGLAALGRRLWIAPTVRAVGPYTVNSTGDAPDANTGDNKCETTTLGECTLRAAIMQANADGVATPINITATGVITLSSNLPSINTNLTIVGPGADRLTIHGANSYRPFYISSGRTVVISGLTLTRGRSYDGGAIYNSMSTLTISACTVSYNTAVNDGGGIFNYGGALVIQASTISNNMVTDTFGYGGGIYNGMSGDLVIEASVISNNVLSNTSGGSGGGLYLSSGDASLINSVVTDNRAASGTPGISIAGNARLRHTTIARNTGGDGSGVYVTGSSTPVLTNTILVRQTVGITITSGSTATLNGVLWYGNTVTNTGGAGAVTVWNAYTGDPAFAADGYHLTAGSTAINKGVDADSATDIDGEPRDAAPDLGADEFRTCWARLNNDLTDYGHAQAAVDASTRSTDVVKVAGYCPGASSRAGSSQAVYISKTVTIRGGYTAANWTTFDPVAHPTTLDALGQGRVMYITGNIAPTIAGLRITGGNSAQGGSDYGGGVYIVTATATLRNNWIFGNTANSFGYYYGYGGGLYLSYSPATLVGNTISDNSVSGAYGNYGGGLYLNNSPATLNGNTIVSNTSSYGGGLYLASSDATLSQNSVVSNTAGYGGGLYLSYSDPTLDGNTVTFNTANYGGGSYLSSSSNPDLNNNVVTDNRANNTGSGIFVYDALPRLRHTTIARNTGGDGSGVYFTGITNTMVLTNTVLVSQRVGITVTSGNTAILNGVLWYSNTANTAGAGIITVTNVYTGNPAFAADGYHLTASSPAIDRGVSSGVITDIDGDPRPQGSGYDLGADEAVLALSGVAIRGPVVGNVNTAYTFVAAVSPGTATPPITFLWQVIGQLPVTHTSGMSDAVTFTWPSGTTGTQTITVTATSISNTVSGIHTIGIGGSEVVITPGLGGILIYTDTQGLTTTIEFPPGAVTDTTTIVYTPIPTPTEPVSPGLRFAGQMFDLDAFRNDQLIHGFTFSGTVTITIHYSDTDVVGIDESTLRLYRWRQLPGTIAFGWELVGTRPGEGQRLDTANNVLTAWLRRLSKFGNMGEGEYDVFLPTILNSD